MSNTVDSRIVEMRFDNKNFESNVAQSMSTLDKLKAKLNLSGASKGLENLDKAAKSTNLSGLAKGVETVNARFSAMQIAGMTAISRITNAAMSAGKNITSALTINPVKDGLAEYETQINAVQTILANTQKEGTNVKMVNAALDELNTYADKTIYNFTEMTRNIGTFTAAGVKLNTSVKAIQGIANLAAVSGSTSQQASTAMYQLSQALAAGKVNLMDWNSVVNAGMGGQVFQDALIRTSENLKTGAKEAIKTAGTFRESLTKSGWLTTEVLTETLNQFSGAYSKADLMSQGYTEKQADEITKMAETATEAATKVKTFTQLIDTLKEALGSGWTTTWRLIIGDFEEAKSLWTGVSDILNNFINNMSNARNAVIESAMGKGLGAMSKEINKAFNGINNAAKAVDKVSTSLTNLGKISSQVINGDFGNGEERFKKLTKAGINYYAVQNAVNKALGNSKRYTKEQIAEQDKLVGTKNKTTESTKKETDANTKLTNEQKKQIIAYAQMSDAQLKAAGVTKEQQQALNDLKDTSEQMGIPIKELVMNMDQINGRWLLLKGFANIGNGLIKVFKSIGSAWKETMDPITATDLFNVIVGFQKMTRSLVMTNQTADKLKRTFKGLFALLDMVMTVTGGGLKLAFKVLSMVLKAFDTDLLTVTANIGDAIVAIRDFLFSNSLITSGFQLIADGVKMAVDAIKSFIDMLQGIPQVQNFVNFFNNINWNEVGQNVIDGLEKGLEGGISKIPQILIQIGQSMLDAIKGVLGIASPAKRAIEIGEWTIEGLIIGIQNKLGQLGSVLSNVGNIILSALKNIDLGKVLSLGAMVGFGYLASRVIKVFENISSPFAGLGSIFENAAEIIEKSNDNIQKILKNTAKVVKAFANVINAKAWQMKASAVKDMAISIAILAGAVYVLAKLDTAELQKGVTAIGALAGILVALAFAMNKLDGLSVTRGENGFNVKGLKTSLLSIGTAILLIAAAVKLMGSLKPEQAEQGFKGLAGIILAIGGLLAVYGTMVKGKSAKNSDKAGKMIKRLATSLLVVALAAKIIGTLSPSDMSKGAAFMVAFGIFVAAMTKVATVDGKIADKLGGMMIKMAIAMGLMAGVVKLVAGLSPSDMAKGGLFAAAFVAFVYGLRKAVSIDNGSTVAKLSLLLFNISNSMMMMVGVVKLVGLLSPNEMLKGVAFAAAFLLFVKALTNIVKMDSGQQIAKVSGLILSVSVSMLMLIGVMKLVSTLTPGEFVKGAVAIGVFTLIIKAMTNIAKSAGNQSGKLALTLLGMATAIAIMAGVSVLLGMIDTASLAKGIIAVGLLSSMVALMVRSTKGSGDAVKNIATLAIAIAAMVGAVIILTWLDPQKMATAVACLSGLMIAFGIMSKLSSNAKTSIKSMTSVLVVIGLLATVCAILGSLSLDMSLETATSLSELILAISGAVTILGHVKSVSKTAIAGVAGVATVVAALAAVLGVLNKYDFNVSIETATAMSELILALSTSCAILGSISGLSGSTAANAGKLLLIVTGVAALMTGVTGLVSLIPGAQKFLDGGIEVLQKIGYGLGSFLGNIVGGFSAGATSGLPSIGENLSAFMQAFSQIDSKSLDGVKTLSNAMLEISAASFLDGISKFINFGKSPIETFAENIKTLANAIVDVASSLNANGPVDLSNLESIANVGSVFAKLQDTVAPAGGLLQAITGEGNLGEKDLSSFGTQVSWFINQIRIATDSLSGDNAIDVSAIQSVVTAGNMLAELQKALPEESWFDSKMNLSQFGQKISAFGTAMHSFASSIGDIDLTAISTAVSIAKRISTFVKSLKDFDASGITNFSKVSSLGRTLNSFSSSVGSFDSGTVSSAISAANRLKSFINGLKDLDTSGISKFQSAVSKLGQTDVSSAAKSLSSGASKLASVGSSMTKSLTSGLKSGSGAATSAASSLAKSMTSKLSGSSGQFSSAGTKLVMAFVKAISSKRGSAVSAAKSVATGAASAMRGGVGSAHSAGMNLGQGYVNGVRAKVAAAYAAGYAVGAAGARGINAGQHSRSPSRLAFKSGVYLGEGYVNGAKSMMRVVSDAGYNMGEAATQSLSDSSQKLAKMVDMSFDSNPTIRPVVDMTDVTKKSEMLSALFNDPMVSSSGNIRAIRTIVDNRQNGNEEIVLAVNKLRKDLGNVGNTYNSINGITYDNGSEISEAVGTLVRAARIERRR